MAFVWFILGMLTMVGILFFAFYMFCLGATVGGKKDPGKKNSGNGLHLVKEETETDGKS